MRDEFSDTERTPIGEAAATDSSVRSGACEAGFASFSDQFAIRVRDAEPQVREGRAVPTSLGSLDMVALLATITAGWNRR